MQTSNAIIKYGFHRQCTYMHTVIVLGGLPNHKLAFALVNQAAVLCMYRLLLQGCTYQTSGYLPVSIGYSSWGLWEQCISSSRIFSNVAAQLFQPVTCTG